MRKGDNDLCVRCGETRLFVRTRTADCARVRWDESGEFTVLAEWPRHKWLKQERESDQNV